MIQISTVKRVQGLVTPPGDKSISHRALILTAMAVGRSELFNLAPGEDVHCTRNALNNLGVQFKSIDKGLMALGVPKHGGYREPGLTLNCGNSGTTARLLLGLLAGRSLFATLTGDASLKRRPMGEVVVPLRKMGAQIIGPRKGDRLPLAIQGGHLDPVDWKIETPSAQTKSALLIAAVQAVGESRIREAAPTRDHTERLMKEMGAEVRVKKGVFIVATSVLRPISLEIPGDFSSGAFFLALAAIHPKADVVIEGVGLNPTRTGLLDALKKMGAKVGMSLTSRRGDIEPFGNVRVRSSSLRGISIDGREALRMIDELPLFALAATQAIGRSVVTGVPQLRMKESDRILGIVQSLRAMGARIRETADGFSVEGPTPLRGAEFSRITDHRILMMLAIAGCVAEGTTSIHHDRWVAVSYPGFFEDLQRIGR
ncbi:MAG: 3-phosphoshikimate 1-carboxyvinyltransferase [bacterium]